MNQMESEQQQAYKLSKDLDRVEEIDGWEAQGSADVLVIGELAKRDGFERLFYKPEPIDSINEIRMEGAHIQIEGLDYIVTNPDLPVMSKRMLSVLESVGYFPHQTISVTIEDTVLVTGTDGKLQPSGKINTDYVAVQLLEQLDIFDRKKSIYEPSFINPNDVGDIDKLVLKVPPQGLPPIFRIKDNRTYLYVSPEAKTALEEAGITGIRFVRIDLSKP